jgi:metallo-beta-lactamase family protein
MVRLHFHGAAHGVTGSCFLLETSRARLLVDCGLFQGSKTEKELNYRPFPFRPASLDAMVLTHAHIDHSGLIPKLFREGFAGPVHATPATIDLCSVMLPDSGHIQEMEVLQLNRRNARRGRGREVDPIYTAEDAKACLSLFRRFGTGHWFDACEGIRARFWNAGHLLGSCSVELDVTDDGAKTRLLFSGDLGPAQKLLQSDPEAPANLDYVVCESTYGDVLREVVDPPRRRARLRDEVLAARHGGGGALLIPAFAVERTQELLLDLVTLMADGDVPDAPVFIDSPLATRASEVFAAHAGSIENGQALAAALTSPRVRFTETVEQSKAISRVSSFHIIMAASGMCEAGRIRHHLKDWLWRKDGTVLLVGFQAQGTLGRILQDGASRVRIQGEDIEVRARVRSIDLYSGHADAKELTAWIRGRLPISQNLFLVHGEEPALAGLRDRVSGFVQAGRVVVPVLDSAYALTPGGAAECDAPRRIPAEQVARLDWHNDLSRLLLDIDDAVRKAADERARRAVIRRIRRALDDGGPAPDLGGGRGAR